jgi:hypothetical protein
LQTNFPGTSAIKIAHLSKAFKRGSWRVAFGSRRAWLRSSPLSLSGRSAVSEPDPGTDLSPVQPPPTLASVFDEDRFYSVMEFADTAISLWISIREAAYRRERETLDLYCKKISLLTKATFGTVKSLAAQSGGGPGDK